MNTQKYKTWRNPKYGMVYGESIKTPVGRVSFPALVTPKAPPPPQEGQAAGSPRYEVTQFLAKGTAETDAFIAAITAMSEQMKNEYNAGSKGVQIGGFPLLIDGDAMDTEKYPQAKGNWLLCARNAKPIKVYDRTKKETEAAKVVGGVKVVLVVTPHVGSYGLKYRCEALQIIEDDGVRFGGGVRDMSDFLENLDGEPSVGEALDKAVTPIGDAPTAAAKGVAQAVALL